MANLLREHAAPCMPDVLRARRSAGVASRENLRSLAGEWDAYVALARSRRASRAGDALGFAHFAARIPGSPARSAAHRNECSTVAPRCRRKAIPSAENDGEAIRQGTGTATRSAACCSHPANRGRRMRLVRRSARSPRKNRCALAGPIGLQYPSRRHCVFMNVGRPARSYVHAPWATARSASCIQRTPYTAHPSPGGRFWAAREYIFIAQHVRTRHLDGSDFGDYTTTSETIHAWKWAVASSGRNGRVGLIGHSDEGALVYAGREPPPTSRHRAVGASRSWRIAPYEDMVFLADQRRVACLMPRARAKQNDSTSAPR